MHERYCDIMCTSIKEVGELVMSYFTLCEVELTLARNQHDSNKIRLDVNWFKCVFVFDSHLENLVSLKNIYNNILHITSL